MALKWKAAFNLTESEIRHAMRHTRSNREAAEYLRISYKTWQRYASMYYDAESGKNLFELHRETKRHLKRKIPAGHRGKSTVPIEEILSGNRPGYNIRTLENRLIVENILPERCNICGYNQRRVTDFKVPLKLIHKDGNSTNHRLENLELVCYNCIFIYHGDVLAKRVVNTSWYKRDREQPV